MEAAHEMHCICDIDGVHNRNHRQQVAGPWRVGLHEPAVPSVWADLPALCGLVFRPLRHRHPIERLLVILAVR